MHVTRSAGQREVGPEIPLGPVPLQWNESPCLDFVDSEFADHAGSGRRFDRLPLAAWQRAFLDHWGWTAPTPVPPDRLPALRELRSLLRRLLEGAARGKGMEPGEVRHLNALLAASPFVYAIGEDGRVTAAPVREDWDRVVAELVRSTVDLMTTSNPGRIKVCANPDCSWMFYDESLNRSRRWCLTSVCGNLVKVRRHRARRRDAAG
jgi:predicted RNA-binding Zn ribbon-like protein